MRKRYARRGGVNVIERCLTLFTEIDAFTLMILPIIVYITTTIYHPRRHGRLRRQDDATDACRPPSTMPQRGARVREDRALRA